MAGSTDDAAVLRAVAADPHFAEWLPCPSGIYILLRESAPPAYEHEKPFFFTATELGSTSADALPAALLQDLRVRNTTASPLPPLDVLTRSGGNTPSAHVWFSLPGYDRATDRAAVAVTRGTLDSCPAAGYIVVLRRSARAWRVESRPTEWVE